MTPGASWRGAARRRLRRVPWRSAAVLALAVGVALGIAAWLVSVGGPAAFRARWGVWAPLVSVPLHVLTTLTPVGEVLPFGIANGALYGVGAGAALNWVAWMAAAALQYRFGAAARREASRVTDRPSGAAPTGVGPHERPAPRWLSPDRFAHPAVLVAGRWLPGGGPLVDAAAGAAGVPFGRAMACAALGHAPQAVAIAAVGAGLLRLL